METTKEVLNQVLVKIFNKIIFNEENYLLKEVGSKITINGVHILQAIEEAGEQPSMKNIAETLNITAGTLSVGLKRLIEGGYVTKTQSAADKRIYLLALTPTGKKVCKIHSKYHQELIDTITRNLSTKEEAALVDLISKVKYFVS